MLTQQIISNFIGRQAEIEICTQWFADENPDAPKILYLYDALEPQEKKGGAGKTWLLRRFASIVETRHPGTPVVLIDFFDVASRDGVVIAEHIVEALKKSIPQLVVDDFTEALKSYQENTGMEHQENAEQRSALSQALAADLKKLDRYFSKAKTFLLVIFDTTEIIERTPSIASLSLSHLFPDPYQFQHIKFVIASRNPIDWSHPNWLGRQIEVIEVPVKPFNSQEMIEYLIMEATYDPTTHEEVIQKLYDLTEGRPIMVGLVADVLNNFVASVEDLVAVPPIHFESHLVLQIQQLEKPVNWVILFMAHVYHRFNGDILHWILSKTGLNNEIQNLSHEELMNRLPPLSFVRTSASRDYLVLHDEMRRLVNKYCWERQDPERGMRNEISQSVIEYYEQEIQTKMKAQVLSEQERQVIIVEILFHRLFLNRTQGLHFFQNQFLSALNLSKRPFARTMLQETLMFWNEMDEIQKRDLQLLEADLLRIEEEPTAALAIYQQLEMSANQEWLLAHEATICREKGECYLLQSRFSEAIQNIQRALDIETMKGNEHQVGALLNKLGFAYRNQGQFDKAQQYYEQGLNHYAKLANQSEYANMINNLSNIYRLRGKTQIALRYCQIGLHIRKSIFQAGKGSEYPVALSLSTMGLIYLDGGHFVWGGQQFQEAFEIHLRLGRKRELAQLYNRFAQIAMARRVYEEAKNLLQHAEAASIDTNAEAYINCLNKQGRLEMLQKHWSDAAPFFVKALGRAREVHDAYQQAENLVDLAEAFYRLNQIKAAENSLQEARAISEQWHYNDLLGRAEEFLGNISYEARQYKTAFKHYRQFCRYMALRSDVEYHKTLEIIIDKLYEVPSTEVTKIIDDFIAYWSKEKMQKNYPELKKTLEDISKAKSLEHLPATSFLPPLDL